MTTRIVYTVDLQAPGFPVRFLSAGKLGHFNGPFADPGEACNEFECCYEAGSARYVEPAEFEQMAAGAPAFLETSASEGSEQPTHCTKQQPVCPAGLSIQCEATRLYGWYLDALIQKMDHEAVDIRYQCWKYVGEVWDNHLQVCSQKKTNAAGPKIYPSLESAQEALDRGETVRIEVGSLQVDPHLVQLALDLQAKERLNEWLKMQQAEGEGTDGIS